MMPYPSDDLTYREYVIRRANALHRLRVARALQSFVQDNLVASPTSASARFADAQVTDAENQLADINARWERSPNNRS